MLRLDPETGEMTYASQNSAGVNPAYVTIDAQNRFLYAVDEHDIFEGDSGAVTMFAMDNLIVFILACRKPQMCSKTGKGDAGNLIVIHPGTFVIVDDQAKSAVLSLDKFFQRPQLSRRHGLVVFNFKRN